MRLKASNCRVRDAARSAALSICCAPGRSGEGFADAIEPGGIVPWHSHADRPALIYVEQGEIHEFASNCAAPIVHKAGDLRRETSETSHWWKNLGDTTVILLVGDVLHDKNDHHM